MSNYSNVKKLAMNGIVQNPVFVLVLGMCPVIKKTVNISDAFYLGVATLIVIVLSNIIISALKKIIPDKVRLPVYIIIIAALVTLIEVFLKSEIADNIVPGLYENIGEMISLIAVNCIVFSRAESFASKNTVFESLIDGLSMGIGFILALCVMGGLRQVLYSAGFDFFVTTAGGFLLLGLLMAFFNMVYDVGNNYFEKKSQYVKLKAEVVR